MKNAKAAAVPASASFAAGTAGTNSVKARIRLVPNVTVAASVQNVTGLANSIRVEGGKDKAMNKHVRLGEWDARIAPRLQDLEWCGTNIARYARHIHASIQCLPFRPAWETLAHDALEQAEKELQLALAIVRAAKDQYDKLPAMADAAE